MKGADSLKMASITLISIAVVSNPVNAHQSLTTRPAPITSEPRFTVPACRRPISENESPVGVSGDVPPKAPVVSCSTRLDLEHSSWGVRALPDS
jgi:hypothetical protein